MARSKKIFLLLSALFIGIIIYITIDIFSRTTFPGAKKQQLERSEKALDSLQTDPVTK